jgi:hypothetical protein
MVSYSSKRLVRFPICSGKVPTIDASVKLLQNPWSTKWEVINMFKELEHWTQFSNLVHYSEVTDLYVLYIHASFCRCFPRQDRQLFIGSTFGANVSILIQIKVLEMWINGQKSVTLWNRPWKNSLPPNRWLTLPGSPHSWVEQALPIVH